MVKLIAAMAFAVALMFTGFVQAKDAAAKPLAGKVTDVTTSTDGKTVTGFTVHSGKKGDTGTDTAFTVDSSTKVTLGDGTTAADAAAVLGAIVKDAHVKVVSEDKDGKKLATSVTVVVHKKKNA